MALFDYLIRRLGSAHSAAATESALQIFISSMDSLAVQIPKFSDMVVPGTWIGKQQYLQPWNKYVPGIVRT